MSAKGVDLAEGLPSESTAAPITTSKTLVARVVTRINNVALALCSGATAIMVLHVLLNVGSRNAVGYGIPDTLAFVSFLWMPLICFLALGTAQLRQEHITVTLLVDRLGPRARRVADIVAELLVVVMLLWLCSLALTTVSESFAIGEREGLNRWIVLWPVKLFVMAGMGLYVLSTVVTLVERIRTKPQPTYKSGGAQ
jgi:TRAP-type C4-dicarboxylate transport system permease small subunit